MMYNKHYGGLEKCLSRHGIVNRSRLLTLSVVTAAETVGNLLGCR